MEKIYDMIVLGGGPAGYTAAMYAARSGLSTLVLEKLSAGGQMALTEKIDNYPGMEEGIDGFLLGEKMQKSAERLAVFFFNTHANSCYASTNAGRQAARRRLLFARSFIFSAFFSSVQEFRTRFLPL